MSEAKRWWRRLQRRRWQRVVRRSGHYVVVTHLSEPHRGCRWEVEWTNPRGRTLLRYYRTRREVREYVRGVVKIADERWMLG